MPTDIDSLTDPRLLACRDLAIHAREAMLDRLIEKVNVWGNSWQDGTYGDTLNRTAETDELRAAAIGELRKRAADVANQAFFLADPVRLLATSDRESVR